MIIGTVILCNKKYEEIRKGTLGIVINYCPADENVNEDYYVILFENRKIKTIKETLINEHIQFVVAYGALNNYLYKDYSIVEKDFDNGLFNEIFKHKKNYIEIVRDFSKITTNSKMNFGLIPINLVLNIPKKYDKAELTYDFVEKLLITDDKIASVAAEAVKICVRFILEYKISKPITYVNLNIPKSSGESRRFSLSMSKDIYINQLDILMDEAVQIENYEACAELRDMKQRFEKVWPKTKEKKSKDKN